MTSTPIRVSSAVEWFFGSKRLREFTSLWWTRWAGAFLQQCIGDLSVLTVDGSDLKDHIRPYVGTHENRLAILEF